MKYLTLILALMSLDAMAELSTYIPSKTTIPFFRIYEGVSFKKDKNVARVSVSKLVKDFSEGDRKRQWSLETGYDSLEIPLDYYQQIRSWGDAVLEATPGDDSNSFGTVFHIGGGYVLTNHHVLSTTRANLTQCKSMNARTGDHNDKFRCERVVHCNKEADYCVIKMKEWKSGKRKPETLPSVKLKVDSHPQFDAPYAVIGNTDGKGLHFSKGKGIGRVGDKRFVFYAPVHGGNSGGPLMNEQGEVIGVVEAQSAYGEAEDAYNVAVPLDFIIDDLHREISRDDEVFKYLLVD